MAAPTNYYVDPSIAANTGTGTSGDPWGDLEYGLGQITRDATNGDQINVKAGTTETLVAALDVATYGTPAMTTPLIFRGYTSTAGDGGIGVVSGGGSVSIFASTTLNYVMFVDMHLTNTGSNIIVQGNDGCVLVNCELDTSSGIAIDCDNKTHVINCYIHGCTGTYAIMCAADSSVYGNFINSGVTTAGISIADGYVAHNVVKLSATNAKGIIFSDNTSVFNNSVFATAGTNVGIAGSGSGRDMAQIFNNIVEGFSGFGGVGYDFSSTDHTYLWGYNAAYNNTTNKSASGEIMVDIGGDIIPLTASAFTDPSTNDFSVTTEVKALALPAFTGGGTTPGTTQYLDMGAAQRQEPAGGGGGGCKIAGPGGGIAG